MASSSWSDTEKKRGVGFVVEMLEMLAENDDFFVNEASLRKQIIHRWPDECASRVHASLWIGEAVEVGSAIKIKKVGNKKKIVCLPKCHKWLADLDIEAEKDFSGEERHVYDLLWGNNGWMLRTDVISSLKSNFESMSDPPMRLKMFSVAKEKGLFHVGKGPYFHTVGLTYDDAVKAIEIASGEMVLVEQASATTEVTAKVEEIDNAWASLNGS